jgi:hypothetical protein
VEDIQENALHIFGMAKKFAKLCKVLFSLKVRKIGTSINLFMLVSEDLKYLNFN